MSCCGGAKGLDEFNRLLRFPENLVANKVLPTPLAVVAAVLSGMVKTVLFPVISALGIVLFPMKACYERYQGRNAGKFWEASLISMAATSASLLFLIFAAYNMPILAASGVVLAAMTISIVVHVHHACKDPVTEPGSEDDFP